MDDQEMLVLVLVRVRDVTFPYPGSKKTTCENCGAACWISPDVIALAKELVDAKQLCTCCFETDPMVEKADEVDVKIIGVKGSLKANYN